MPVIIDQRPLHVLLARKGFPFFALALLAVLFNWALHWQVPTGLSLQGWQAILVFLLCLVLWVTQLLPLPVTSILGLALLPSLGVLPASDVYALFGNQAVFFILGAFILAAGIMKSGLSEHLALAVFRRFDDSPRRLLLSMLLLPAVMSFFMPEHAVAAVLLPIVWAIVRGLDLPKGDAFGASLFMALAWGAVIGGVMTLLGGARGPLALAIVDEMTGRGFSFVEWTLAAAPMVIGMLVVAVLILVVKTPVDSVDMAGARARIEERRLELGQLSLSGAMMAVLMALTMAAWIWMGESTGLAAVALLSVVAMFALRIVAWREIQSHVDWGVVLMYGGAIAVAKALEKSGAAAWLASSLWPGSASGWMLLLALGLLTILLTEAISNSAAVAIILPIAISMAATSHTDPLLVALGVGIVSGFAFMLPMGTPANAMVFSTGYVSLGRMIRLGAILMLSTLLLFALVTRYWWPYLNIGVGL